MTDFIDDLRSTVDDVLQIRDEIGVVKAEVSFVTRSWSGETVGDGSASEAKEKVIPTPHVVDLSHNIRLQAAGSIQQGDILLKSISKKRYPDLTDVDGSSESKNIERFYEIGDKLYKVINVVSKYATWAVQVRKLTDETRY